MIKINTIFERLIMYIKLNACMYLRTSRLKIFDNSNVFEKHRDKMNFLETNKI